jgi:hypothetical protein
MLARARRSSSCVDRDEDVSMKHLAGRGPLRVLRQPESELPELSGFDFLVHGEDCTDCDDGAPIGWTASRRVGFMLESVSLSTAVTHGEAARLGDDTDVEWPVRADYVADAEWFGSPIALFSALAGVGIAFYTTYAVYDRLPSAPAAHFSLATLILFSAFAASSLLIWWVLVSATRLLVARSTQRPTQRMRARIERLVELAAATPVLGVRSSGDHRAR